MCQGEVEPRRPHPQQQCARTGDWPHPAPHEESEKAGSSSLCSRTKPLCVHRDSLMGGRPGSPETVRRQVLSLRWAVAEARVVQ